MYSIVKLKCRKVQICRNILVDWFLPKFANTCILDTEGEIVGKVVKHANILNAIHYCSS